MIKQCPICKSSSVIIIGKLFKCKKCGFLNKPMEKNERKRIN